MFSQSIVCKKIVVYLKVDKIDKNTFGRDLIFSRNFGSGLLHLHPQRKGKQP